MYDRKKNRSAQNVTDVSSFVVNVQPQNLFVEAVHHPCYQMVAVGVKTGGSRVGGPELCV